MALPQPHPNVLRRAQRGDEAAFCELVRLYQLPLFNYVLRLVGNRPLAEDLTQEVFLRVFQALPRFSGRSRFTTWLFQIAKHRVVDEMRALERRPRPSAQLEDLEWPATELSADGRQTIVELWRAIGDLEVDLRMALLLRDVVGLSYREIADVLEITLASVKWRIYEARERVAAAVEAEERLVAAG